MVLRPGAHGLDASVLLGSLPRGGEPHLAGFLAFLRAERGGRRIRAPAMEGRKRLLRHRQDGHALVSSTPIGRDV